MVHFKQSSPDVVLQKTNYFHDSSFFLANITEKQRYGRTRHCHDSMKSDILILHLAERFMQNEDMFKRVRSVSS